MNNSNASSSQGLAEAKFASVLFTIHQIHLIKKMNCWQVRWLYQKSSLRYLYRKYFMVEKQCCTFNGVIHIHIFVCTVITREIFIISVFLILDNKKHICACCFYFISILHFQAEVKLEYLLNLSILISKGKEINRDCLSNGEWTGKSSLLKRVRFTFDMRCSIWGDYCMVPVRVSSFDQGFNHRRC